MSELHYIQHHGIKGMRWGIRRYQRKDGSLTAAGKKRYSDSDGSDKLNDQSEKKGLTDKQKKTIKVGAAVVGMALAVYGGYKLSQLYSGAGANIDPETGFRLIDKNMSDKQNLMTINPGRVRLLSRSKNVEIIDGSSTNCMLCTTAYELRKRGYDVRAGLEKTGRGYLPHELFPNLFKNYEGMTKISNNGNSSDILRGMENFAKSQGSGSRGNVVCWWKYGGGHSMIWENVNGSIVFKDGQTGKVYKDFEKQILKHVDIDRSDAVSMLRTDNLEISVSQMKKYLNTDTVFKTYVDHGGEIVAKSATSPVGQLGITAAASTAYYKANVRMAVNNYKKQHPRTKLSDKEIAKLLSKT